MGYYAPSNTVAQYELWFQSEDNSCSVPNAAADRVLGTLVLPATIQGTPRAAYLDVFFNSDDGTAHYFAAAVGENYIQVTDGSTTVDNSRVRATDYERKPVANIPAETVFLGDVDISALITGGATLTVTLKGAHANAVTIFYGVYFRVRVIT